MALTPAGQQPLRIGVFGGAFDPPHVAHRALLQTAMTDLQLDRLHVIPTGHAWHKTRALSSVEHRLAMARLAFADLPGVLIDPRETRRAGPSYTVDTLRELKAEWSAAHLFLIVGDDQARVLDSWHEWREILRLAIICVAERDDATGNGSRFHVPDALAACFRRLSMPAMSVSATEIRARIAARQSVSSLVFESVARYIDHHHLYQIA